MSTEIEISPEIRDYVIASAKKFFSISEKSEHKIGANSHIANDLGGDSLNSMEFLLDVEHKYGISILDEVSSTFQTLGDVMTYIQGHAKNTLKQ